MTDNFRLQEIALDSPAVHAYLVSPNDSTDLPFASRGIFANGGGPVKLEFLNDPGAPVTLTLAASTIYPIRVRRIWANGTSATGIHVLY